MEDADESTKEPLQPPCFAHANTGFCVQGTLCKQYHDPRIPFDSRYIPMHLKAITDQTNQLLSSVDSMRKDIKKMKEGMNDFGTFLSNLKTSLELYGFTILPTGDIKTFESAVPGAQSIKELGKLSERVIDASLEQDVRNYKKTSPTMDLLDEWQDANFGKSPYIPDLTLSTAIRDDTTQFLCDFLNNRDISKIPLSLKKTCLEAGESVPEGRIVRVATAEIYPLLWEPHASDLKCHYDLKKFLKASIPLANTLTKLAETSFFNELDNSASYKRSSLPCHVLDDDSIKLLVLRLNWTRVRDLMYEAQVKRSTNNQLITGINEFKSIRVRDFLLIDIEDTIYVLSYYQVLMIIDTLTSRFLSLEMCKLTEKMKLPYLPTAKFLTGMYKAGDHILTNHGNRGYKSLATWEAICTGVYLKQYEVLDISRNYFEDSVSDLDPILREECHHLFQLVTQGKLNVNQLFELFGCYRHFGHPTVNEDAGCQKLKDKTRTPRKISGETCRMAAGGFIKSFVLNFVRKRGRWPGLYLDPGCSDAFSEYIKERPLNLNEFSAKFDVIDWSYIRFQKEFEFDYFQDFTEILSDKSISPSLNTWTSVYEQSLLSDSWKTLTHENRRVLIEILKNPEFSIRKIMQTVMDGEVPQEWYIVGLHSKEREMKIESRLFAMMVLQMRVYFAVTEANISKNIFPYIPQQTMTMGESELNNHLMSISKETKCTKKDIKPKNQEKIDVSEQRREEEAKRFSRQKRGKQSSKIESIKITGSLDFIKWNWLQTFSANFLVFQVIEDLMGVPNLYNFTHKFFQHSWFYLSSRYHPPTFCRKDCNETLPIQGERKGEKVCQPDILNQQEDPCAWFGQYGGCEGLRQKGWTATTIGLLIALEHTTGIRATITGQGDNQVLVIEMPINIADCTAIEYLKNHKNEAEKRLRDYFDKLQNLVKGMGWELKSSETWFSTSLINYGKEILHRGIFLSSTLKKISRMFPDMSDCYPNLSSRLASLCSTAHSSCQKSFSITPIIWLLYLELSLILQKEIYHGVLLKNKLHKVIQKHKLDVDLSLLSFILHFPKDFGGYPILNPLGMLYRGHPDPITNDIEWLKVLSKQFNWVDKCLGWAYSGEGFSHTCNYSLLIQDPVSLNFQLPSSPVTLTKQVLEETVSSFSQNRDIRRLLMFLKGTEEKIIIDFLMSTEPLSPRVLNEIYRHTTVGAARAFLNIFVEMRTTKNMMSLEQAQHFISTIEGSEIDWFMQVIKNYHYITRLPNVTWIDLLKDQCWFNDFDSFCSTQYVQSIRNRSWKREIHHVTTPSPHHQSKIVLRTFEEEYMAQKEFMEYYILPSHISSDDCPPLNKGVEPPYFGSRTQEKRSSQVLPVQKNDRSLDSTRKLSRLLDWICSRNSSLGIFIQNVIMSRTDLSPALISLVAGENYGGSVQHRFEDVITKHNASLNSRANFSTRVYFSSDGMGKYGGSGMNYPLHYQGWILYIMSIVSNYLAGIYNNEEIRFLIYQIPACSHCLYPLEEKMIDSTASTIPPVSTAQDCLILYNTTQQIFEGLDLTPLRIGEWVFPSFSLMNSEVRKCCAISWILLGESSSVDGPYVVSYSGILEKKHHSSKISQSTFLTINIECLLRSFTKVFMSHYFLHALEIVDKYNVDIKHAYRILLHSLSKEMWKTVRPVILFKEVWAQFLRIKSVTPPSSEVYTQPQHLDAYLYRLITHFLDEIWEEGDFEISLFATTQGIDTTKLLRAWAHSIELYILRWGTTTLDNIRKIFGCTWSELKNQENCIIDHSSFLSKLNDVCNRYKVTTLPNFSRKYKFWVSGSGAEPWMKAPTKKSYALALSRYVPKTIGRATARSRLFSSPVLKLQTCAKFERKRVIPIQAFVHIPVGVKNPITHLRKREDHRYRLTGIYSTAHYKYACLYKIIPNNQVKLSLHLAEGAGGLANFTSRLYGIKEIYYNSLQDLSKFVPQRAHGYVPASLQKLEKECGVKIHGIQDSLSTGGDLLTDVCIKAIISSLKNLPPPDLVTCDAELSGSWNTADAIKLAKNIGKIIGTFEQSTWVFFKTYNENPPVLALQIQIFLRYTKKISLIVPSFSSNECYECFLVFKTDPSAYFLSEGISYTYENVNGENLAVLRSLHARRIRNAPFQCYLQPSELLTLHLSMIAVGIEWNLGVALTNLTKGVIIEEKFWQNPLSEIMRSVSLLYYEITERILSFQKVHKNEPLTLLQLQQRGMSKAESTMLLSKAESLFNARTILTILKTQKLPVNLQDEPLRIYYKGDLIFLYRISFWEWTGTYNRDLNKILGFSTLLLRQ